jgi:asparagine synthase (glutamine-hydrolysing)
MCGIVGTYGKHDLYNLEIPLKRIAHRGPDGCIVEHYHNGALGHARLAIVDIEGGQQPMSNPTGDRWLVCNGEIYNHHRIRAALPDYPFKTKSDSEVILALYERYGPDAVALLDGMYAFALLDRDRLLLARDRLGIKPLYYGSAGKTLYFASEIKALQGIVESIQEFPPGYWYSSDVGFMCYYDVTSVAVGATLYGEDPPTPLQIQQSLRSAVHKRLMSDVPLGVFLSGGLDSSIIAALVCEELDSVHSFAVGMEGSDDLQYARHVANYLGTQHHEYVFTFQEMLAILPEVIYLLESFDPALVRSAIPNFFLSHLAHNHVTVVLSGEGADELYSGYDYLRRFKDETALQRELVEITRELHNRNLQRLDRMTMAHGLEGRVPFLDPEFIALSFSVPIDQKVHGVSGVEKWILRKAFEDMLPEQVVWRPKQKFSKGTGSAQIFERLAEAEISDQDFTAERLQIHKETGVPIKSKEELFYYRIFRTFFKPSIAPLVGRSRSL